MGKKANGNVKKQAAKRKNTTDGDEPLTKQKKDEKWFPGKFVLLKTQDETANEKPDSTPPKASSAQTKKKNEKLNGNGDSEKINSHMNGKSTKKQKSISTLSKVLQNDLSESSDEEWMSVDDDECESSSDDDHSEEWSTDTDYSEGESLDDEEEYSFHESDCESVSDNEESWNHGNWCENSSDDSDYVPEIEDKYISRGEATIYDAKGLDLAFGNSFDSQIIEINDIHPAIMQQEENVPELVLDEPLNEIIIEEVNNKSQTVAATRADAASIPNPESLINDLHIDDDDDGLECSKLLKHAAFCDCTENQGVVVKLTNTIHFHGILIIRSIANNVQVNGYSLKPNEVVTAASISRADYFLNLTPVINETFSQEKVNEVLKTLISEENASNLMSNFNPKTEAIIHLQQGLPDTTLEMLKNYSTNALLPSKKMIFTNSPCQSSEIILSAKFFVGSENQKISSFELNEQWNNLVIKTSSRLAVIGGKNVGKSNLCQFLINKNIHDFGKILLIDLDIGQPICGASQTVSATMITLPIIGPGYLGRNQPDRSFMYGDKSVMIAPFKYVRCVRQLMEFCVSNPDYQNIPWLINTMGYQKGFGLQLVCLLLRLLQPTDVVQIQHGIKSYNFSKIVTEETVNKLEFSFFDADDVVGVPKTASFTTHVLDSTVNNREVDLATKWVSNASDKRKMSMLAQLAKLLKGNQTSLNDVTPFAAPISKIRMVVVDEEYDHQGQGFNIDLLNANLVYLCRFDENEQLDSTSILECFGVGIVRGIDKINEKIFILLPQSEDSEQLQTKVNVLAIGNIPLPAEILLKQNYNIEGNIPHVTFFKDRNASSQKYVNKRNIKDCY